MFAHVQVVPKQGMNCNCKFWVRAKTEFISPCSHLGQFQSTRDFSNFLWAKWSFHGVLNNAKRINLKEVLRRNLQRWEVGVVTWSLGWAFGQAAWGMFGHFEIPSWWHYNFWFPRAFWVKLRPNDIWHELNKIKKEWNQKSNWAENGKGIKYGSWQGFSPFWQLGPLHKWGP